MSSSEKTAEMLWWILLLYGVEILKKTYLDHAMTLVGIREYYEVKCMPNIGKTDDMLNLQVLDKI